MKITSRDINQRLEILQIITDTVIHQKNEQLTGQLVHYQSDNVQWVLNMVKETLEEIEGALEMQDYSNYLNE